MINGSPFGILFEILWTSMSSFYPAIATYFMFKPEEEASLLLDYFWIVYISVPV